MFCRITATLFIYFIMSFQSLYCSLVKITVHSIKLFLILYTKISYIQKYNFHGHKTQARMLHTTQFSKHVKITMTSFSRCPTFSFTSSGTFWHLRCGIFWHLQCSLFDPTSPRRKHAVNKCKKCPLLTL